MSVVWPSPHTLQHTPSCPAHIRWPQPNLCNRSTVLHMPSCPGLQNNWPLPYPLQQTPAPSGHSNWSPPQTVQRTTSCPARTALAPAPYPIAHTLLPCVPRSSPTCPARPLRRPALLTSMHGKPAASSSVSCHADQQHAWQLSETLAIHAARKMHFATDGTQTKDWQ